MKQRRTSTLDHLHDPPASDLDTLLDVAQPPAASPARDHIDGAVVGTLVGFADDGAAALIVYPGQPGTAALRARATVDLLSAQVGRCAVIVFEHGDPRLPIVVGCMREQDSAGLPQVPGQVEVDADGQRLVVSAKEQVVLRCGKASITLTRAGKVLVEGTYVSSKSSGVQRIKGGSVQIN